MNDHLIKYFNTSKYKEQSKLANDEEYKEIILLTSFLPENTKIGQRIWHIKNNYFSIPVCEFCGSFISYDTKHSRYGFTCSNKDCKEKIYESENWKNKLSISREKSRETCLKKYGSKNVLLNDDIKKKSKQTYIEKYGVENPLSSEKIRDDIKKTCLEKYGVENYSKSEEFKLALPEIIKKRNKECKEIFGFENYSNSNQKTLEIENNFKFFMSSISLFNNLTYVRYIGNNSHLLNCKKCNNNFIFNTKQRRRIKEERNICTICNPKQKQYSNDEKQILEFVSSIYEGEIIENYKNLISPYELDIYLPDLNLAIEFNGLYWHSNNYKDKNYHKIKSDLCKEKGVHLIHIFEDDWNLKQDIVKSVLSNFINKQNQTIIYARKCIVKEVSFSNTNEFLINNHLLGKLSSFSKSYGLYYKDELVSLMTFKLISKETNQFELSRYAIKINTNVLGGSNRLLKSFLRNNTFSSIITYNDNSVFKGNVYRKLGFQYIRTNSPNYMFYQNNKDSRFSKQSIRKLNVGYKIETEKELGLLRVYNAGNDVYVLEK